MSESSKLASREAKSESAPWLDGARATLALVGLGLLAYGSWLAYRPAGFIVPGALLLVAGVLGALRS